MSRERQRWVVLALFALGIALRTLSLRGDLWLDEIWSIFLARLVERPHHVLTRLHHDNNHYLTTLFLSGVAGRVPEFILRLPSWIFGVGSLGLFWLLARRQAPERATLLLGLAAVSYPLVLYAGEARGYAGGLFFTLLAAWFWPARPLAFGLAALAGLLSHPTFVFPLIAFIAWTLVDRDLPRPLLRRTVLGVLGVVVVALYWVDIRWWTIGGGPRHSMLAIYFSSFAWSAGLGFLERWAPAAGALVALVYLWILLQQRREPREKAWVFYFWLLFGAPLASLLLRPTQVIFERYFFIAMGFSLFLLAEGLARLHRRSRTAAVLVGVFLIIGHAVSLTQLVRETRGHYRSAMQVMVDKTREAVVTVGSDHDFRNRMVVEYYRKGFVKEIRYLDRSVRESQASEWFLTHSQEPRFVAPPVLELPERYLLVGEYGSAPLSGWRWFLYRREGDLG